jgi:hypothetical protein
MVQHQIEQDTLMFWENVTFNLDVIGFDLNKIVKNVISTLF